MFPLSFLSILYIIYVLFLAMTMISVSYVSSLVIHDGKFSFALNRRLNLPKKINALAFSTFSYLPVYNGQNLYAVIDDEITTEDYNSDNDLLEKKATTKVKIDMKINSKDVLIEEITALETTLRHKRRRLLKLLSLTDDYSQAGFARKVAELDSLRKNLNTVHQSHVNDSMALVMKLFLPVLDRLLELNERYEREQNNFAIKGYGALSTDMKNCLNEIGLEKSNIQINSPVDRNQMKVLNVVDNQSLEELRLHSSEYVMEIKQDGYKYKGIVLRLANVIVKKSPDLESITMKRTRSKDKIPLDESHKAS